MDKERLKPEFFSVAEIVRNSGSNTFQLVFENPANNKKTMFLERVMAGLSLDGATIPYTYDQTLTVAVGQTNNVTVGVIVPTKNLNFGSPVNTTLNVGLPTSFSGLVARSITKHPSGECNLDFQGRIIVPPGTNLLVTIVDNRAPGRIGSLAVTVIWSEAFAE